MNTIASPTLAALDAANATGAITKTSKLHDAARQFEALMIGEIMKSERESGSGGWLDGEDEDSGSDSAMDMAEAQLSNALAAGGGLGLAKMIEKTMAPAEAPQPSTGVRGADSNSSGR